MFISTPNGRNWFWRLWQRGNDDAFADWQSWQLPTVSNPFIDPVEIESARSTLPEMIFSQEYLAEFVDDAAGVFRGVRDSATATAQSEAQAGHSYIIGVDWGKHNDFTVVSVIDTTTNELVFIDRFNQIDYAFQIARLETVVQKFHPLEIICESNSMGEPLIEQLERKGLPVVRFSTTNATKRAAIESLAMALERKELSILPEPVLIGELQAYEMTRTRTGTITYSAPSGMHDDCVMSLAIAYSPIVSFGSAALSFPIWSEANITDSAEYQPNGGQIMWGCKDGYTGEPINQRTNLYPADSDPRVILLAQLRTDGTIAIFAEQHSTNKLSENHIIDALDYQHQIVKLSTEGAIPFEAEKPRWAAVDNAPELKLQLQKKRIAVRGKPIPPAPSLQNARSMIGVNGDGVRRVLVHPRCQLLISEIGSNQINIATQKAESKNGHAVAALRALCWHLRHKRTGVE